MKTFKKSIVKPFNVLLTFQAKETAMRLLLWSENDKKQLQNRFLKINSFTKKF